VRCTLTLIKTSRRRRGVLDGNSRAHPRWPPLIVSFNLNPDVAPSDCTPLPSVGAREGAVRREGTFPLSSKHYASAHHDHIDALCRQRMNDARCADSHATTAHRGSGICAGDIGAEVAVARVEIRRRR